jgi:hypothetical protein
VKIKGDNLPVVTFYFHLTSCDLKTKTEGFVGSSRFYIFNVCLFFLKIVLHIQKIIEFPGMIRVFQSRTCGCFVILSVIRSRESFISRKGRII